MFRIDSEYLHFEDEPGDGIVDVEGNEYALVVLPAVKPICPEAELRHCYPLIGSLATVRPRFHFILKGAEYSADNVLLRHSSDLVDLYKKWNYEETYQTCRSSSPFSGLLFASSVEGGIVAARLFDEALFEPLDHRGRYDQKKEVDFRSRFASRISNVLTFEISLDDHLHRNKPKSFVLRRELRSFRSSASARQERGASF